MLIIRAVTLRVYSLHFAVPTPTVTVFPATDVSIYAGSRNPLVLACNISINSSLDSFLTVSITWLREGTPLVNGTDRVTITPLSGSKSPFISTLILSPPSMEDNASFSCRASAMPSIELASVNASDVGEGSTIVVVQGKLAISVVQY